MENAIGKNERVPLHLLPDALKQFPVKGGINYYQDELRIVYSPKYEGKRIYLNFKNASGEQKGGYVILDGGGRKGLLGRDEVAVPEFGFIEFTAAEELFAEFMVFSPELYLG